MLPVGNGVEPRPLHMYPDVWVGASLPGAPTQAVDSAAPRDTTESNGGRDP